MTQKPKNVVINNISYYDAFDLQTYDPVFFYGCNRTIRDIIKRKLIQPVDYLYASNGVKNGWTVSQNQTVPPTKARLLLTKIWTEQNMDSMKEKVSPKKKLQTTQSKSNTDIKIYKQNIQSALETIGADDEVSKVNNVVIKQFKPAPPILDVKEHEKFQADDGEIIEIETRGERHPDKIYFLVADVARGFGLHALMRDIINSTSSYESGEHYEYFLCRILHSKENNSKKSVVKKQLFLTYTGILKVLFAGRAGRVKHFMKWATETLFAVQMGTQKQRVKVAANALGVPVTALREIMSKSATAITCVYRFSLGTCKDLRESMQISDDLPGDHIVIKYGKTIDLNRRIGEHIQTYEKQINEAKLSLMGFVVLDQASLPKAEAQIKNFFCAIGIHLKYADHTELVAIRPDVKLEREIANKFTHVGAEYENGVAQIISRHTSEQREIIHKAQLDEAKLQTKISNTEKQMLILLNQIDMNKKDRENIANKYQKDLDDIIKKSFMCDNICNTSISVGNLSAMNNRLMKSKLKTNH